MVAEIDRTSFPEQDLKQSRNISTLYAPGANLWHFHYWMDYLTSRQTWLCKIVTVTTIHYKIVFHLPLVVYFSFYQVLMYPSLKFLLQFQYNGKFSKALITHGDIFYGGKVNPSVKLIFSELWHTNRPSLLHTFWLIKAGCTDGMNDDSIPFSSRALTHFTVTLNRMQPLLMLLFTPVLFFLQQVQYLLWKGSIKLKLLISRKTF